jgi:hypothetical protein
MVEKGSSGSDVVLGTSPFFYEGAIHIWCRVKARLLRGFEK